MELEKLQIRNEQRGARARTSSLIFPFSLCWLPSLALLLGLQTSSTFGQATTGNSGQPPLPAEMRTVLAVTQPLSLPRGERLPFYILPISNELRGFDDSRAEEVLSQLAARGIGYTVSWNPGDRNATLTEGLRIARIARRVGLPVAVDATACIDGFFDGSSATLHVDEKNQPFADLSFDPGRKMGCPFALEERIPIIRERFEFFLKGYTQAGAIVDFIFADWEIDGPLEWNGAWANSKKCQRCRSRIKNIDDFREFQREIRSIRSRLQRETFAEPVRSQFPKTLVGNYGVNPHGGYRYWYDYYEQQPTAGMPFLADQRARYREWAQEFEPSHYTIAMPVIYTWYPIFGWYDFKSTDCRWFYNGLLEGSSVGQHASAMVPVIPFVHRNTTAPPPNADPKVKPFAPEFYQELLWHLLLRGHDGFFLWCLPDELAEETRLVHEVYAASLAYQDFLNRGKPVTFEVPKTEGTIISGLRLGNRVLVRRTDFDANAGPVQLRVDNISLSVPQSRNQCQVLSLTPQ